LKMRGQPLTREGMARPSFAFNKKFWLFNKIDSQDYLLIIKYILLFSDSTSSYV
jgi:hypothetical protein